MLLSGCLFSGSENIEKVKDETGGFVEFTDKKAHAVNLIPLREKVISPGSKEIRIWVGFGVVTPEDLLVLNVDSKGKISGQKILIYDKNPEKWKEDPEELEYFLEGIYSYCEVISEYNHIESCGLKHNEIFDWAKIYQKLKSFDIWTLPDESKLPKPEITINDGLVMVVELHDSVSYRAYHYGNPAFRKSKEAQNASEIMLFVLGL